MFHPVFLFQLKICHPSNKTDISRHFRWPLKRSEILYSWLWSKLNWHCQYFQQSKVIQSAKQLYCHVPSQCFVIHVLFQISEIKASSVSGTAAIWFLCTQYSVTGSTSFMKSSKIDEEQDGIWSNRSLLVIKWTSCTSSGPHPFQKAPLAHLDMPPTPRLNSAHFSSWKGKQLWLANWRASRLMRSATLFKLFL